MEYCYGWLSQIILISKPLISELKIMPAASLSEVLSGGDLKNFWIENCELHHAGSTRSIDLNFFIECGQRAHLRKRDYFVS